MTTLLTGKPVAEKIKDTLSSLIEKHELSPRLVIIKVGDDPASEFYLNNIIKTGRKLDCQVSLISLDRDVSQQTVFDHIAEANSDELIHGIMLQKPLPRHLDDVLISSTIAPSKDVDCNNPVNLGRLLIAQDGLYPCTPLAVLCTLMHYRISVSGKHVVVIGRSPIVGKPLSNMLTWKKSYANATVTLCHSQTSNLSSITKSSEIVVAAIGKPLFLTSEMIKENSILLDVGINEVISKNGGTGYVGDINFISCKEKALAITPVPGGIGSVTTAILFLNLVKACLSEKGINKSVDDFLALIFNDYQN